MLHIVIITYLIKINLMVIVIVKLIMMTVRIKWNSTDNDRTPPHIVNCSLKL